MQYQPEAIQAELHRSQGLGRRQALIVTRKLEVSTCSSIPTTPALPSTKDGSIDWKVAIILRLAISASPENSTTSDIPK